MTQSLGFPFYGNSHIVVLMLASTILSIILNQQMLLPCKRSYISLRNDQVLIAVTMQNAANFVSLLIMKYLV